MYLEKQQTILVQFGFTNTQLNKTINKWGLTKQTNNACIRITRTVGPNILMINTYSLNTVTEFHVSLVNTNLF